MKKLIIAIVAGLIGFATHGFAQENEIDKLVEQCANSAGNDATYLKDFKVKLNKGPSEKPPVARFPLVLSKNNIYRFSICDSEQYAGKGILRLYDSSKLIFSTYNPESGQEYNPFNFKCQKTGIYHVFISFIDGKPGTAVGILSYVEKN